MKVEQKAEFSGINVTAGCSPTVKKKQTLIKMWNNDRVHECTEFEKELRGSSSPGSARCVYSEFVLCGSVIKYESSQTLFNKRVEMRSVLNESVSQGSCRISLFPHDFQHKAETVQRKKDKYKTINHLNKGRACFRKTPGPQEQLKQYQCNGLDRRVMIQIKL